MAVCPNCDAALELTAAECNKCGALFGPGSQWKPLTQRAVPTFRRAVRLVFYIYVWLAAAVAISLLLGGEAEWIAAFIGYVISQPWWRLLAMLLGPEYLSYGYWPMVVSAGLNVLILGWLAFGRGWKARPASPVDWNRLFFRCLALVSLFGPFLVVIATQIYTRGEFGSLVATYVGLVLVGFPGALLHSTLIVLAVFFAARMMPSRLYGLSIVGSVAWGALLGFIVGLVRWTLARKIVISHWTSFSEVLLEALLLAAPVSICGALFLAFAMKTLRSNYLLQPTGRERPAAE